MSSRVENMPSSLEQYQKASRKFEKKRYKLHFKKSHYCFSASIELRLFKKMYFPHRDGSMAYISGAYHLFMSQRFKIITLKKYTKLVFNFLFLNVAGLCRLSF